MDHGSSLEVVVMCRVVLLLVDEEKHLLQQFYSVTETLAYGNNIKQEKKRIIKCIKQDGRKE
jgi:hypothetical protein